MIFRAYATQQDAKELIPIRERGGTERTMAQHSLPGKLGHHSERYR